jgi:hypothetical protein
MLCGYVPDETTMSGIPPTTMSVVPVVIRRGLTSFPNEGCIEITVFFLVSRK